MKTQKSKTFNVAKFDTSKDIDLETLMAFVNGGKYEKFFVDRPKKVYTKRGNGEYHLEHYTKKGAQVYMRLTGLIQAIGRLTQDRAAAERLVEGLDGII